MLGTHALHFRLLRSKRRSIGFLIDDDGLRVTAPKWVTLAEIESAIHEKQRWILSKLAQRRERVSQKLEAQQQWCDGATLPYLGRNIVLRVIHTPSSEVGFDNAQHILTVCLPENASEADLKQRIKTWLQQQATHIFTERLPLYAAKLGATYSRFALSSATTQWGSCTVDGRIRLNWRLIHFGLPIIDYVVAHELAHLREMNHSPRFWATVQSIYPGYQEARKILRQRGPDTLPTF